jgi:hypothetical protein
MNHNQFKEWLLLSVYDELTPEERKALEQHLPECTGCREELTELNKLSAAAGKRTLIEPSDALLREARRELLVALRIDRSRRGVFERVKEYVSETIAPQYRIAFGAVAMAGVGLFAGYMIFSLPASSSLPGGLLVDEGNAQYSEVGDARIANVRFIDADASDGMVEFVFEAVKPMRIRGSVNDKSVQRVLTHALVNDQNPGVRLRSVNTIATQVFQAPAQQADIIEALIEALKYDENDGVRREALKVLLQFPMTKQIRDAFFYTLMNDKNPGVRIEAIKGMEKAKDIETLVDDQMLNVLQQRVEQDNNNFIRLRARAILQEVQQ